MQRAYFLLRNNVQTGPFALTEIVQQSLQPNDLIWKEGESTSWSTPSGIITQQQSQKKEQPSISKESIALNNTERKIWVQMPRVENSSLEMNTAGAMYSIQPPSATPEKALSNYETTPNEIEIIIHKRIGHTVSLVQLVAAGGIAALAVLVWKSKFTFTPQPDNISYAARPVVFSAEPLHAKANDKILLVSKDTSQVQPAHVLTALKDSNQKKITVKQFAKRSKVSKPPAKLPSENVQSLAAPDQTTSFTEAAVAEEAPSPSETTNTIQTTKKKTLGQTIRGLFRKKKKTDAKPGDVPASE